MQLFRGSGYFTVFVLGPKLFFLKSCDCHISYKRPLFSPNQHTSNEPNVAVFT